MATEPANLALKRDWILANPWLWLLAGLAFVLWSCLWTLTFGVLASDFRVLVLAIGLLLTATGVWMRRRDPITVYLLAFHSGVAVISRMFMGLVFGLLALAIIGFFFATFFYEQELGFRPGPTFLVAISTVPTFFWAAHRTLKRDSGRGPLEVDEETGLALLFATGSCALGTFALHIAELPTDWDTFRLLLRVIAAFSLFGSALVVVSARIRRMAISLLIVLHFTAITTACLSPPPSPWIVQQAWVRLFRPYLHFMYLNNAYHYYAPEPGPTSYLWFRVIYTSPDKNEYGLWYKVPRLDEQGRNDHAMALEYQRYISLTETIAPYDPIPAESTFNEEKQTWELNPFWKNRLDLAPNAEKGPILGVEAAKQLQIPLRPGVPPSRQVYIPSDASRRMLSSYARYVARKFARHPEHPDWEFKSVKIYRVIHFIPPVQWFQNRISPTDPELYHPYYVGNYDRHGELIGDRDPYQFWLIPVLRDDLNNPDSVIRDYARLHAGDPNWIRRRDPLTDQVVWTDKDR